MSVVHTVNEVRLQRISFGSLADPTLPAGLWSAELEGPGNGTGTCEFVLNIRADIRRRYLWSWDEIALLFLTASPARVSFTFQTGEVMQGGGLQTFRKLGTLTNVLGGVLDAQDLTKPLFAHIATPNKSQATAMSVLVNENPNGVTGYASWAGYFWDAQQIINSAGVPRRPE